MFQWNNKYSMINLDTSVLLQIIICQCSHCAYRIELIFVMTMLGCAGSHCIAVVKGNVLNTLTFDLVDTSLLPTIQPSATTFDVLSLKTIVRTWTNHVSRQSQVQEVFLNQVKWPDTTAFLTCSNFITHRKLHTKLIRCVKHTLYACRFKSFLLIK